MINLTDLLKHEILDLYSVEEQIIEAMPAMIEKAKNAELKKALREHLKITEEQKNRLDKLKQTFGEEEESSNGEKKGFFSRLFGGGGGEKCKGMEGIIKEGEAMMGADVAEETLDAVIIACAQKIEHYEICGYGTARAYARELKLQEAERLLTQTLNEEYTADDLLTNLAVGKFNLQAENATGNDAPGTSGRSGRGGGSSNGGNSKGSSKGGSSKGPSKGGRSKNGNSKGGGKSSSKSGSSKGGSKGSSKVGSSKSGSKGGSKSSSSKGGSSSKGSSSSKGGNKSGSKSSSKGRSSRGR